MHSSLPLTFSSSYASSATNLSDMSDEDIGYASSSSEPTPFDVCASCGFSTLLATSRLHRGWDFYKIGWVESAIIPISAIETGSADGCQICSLTVEAITV